MNNKERIKAKILSDIELKRALARIRFMGQKIVFTNGCFDIIHRGHIEYLMQAADLGDILIVGLNSDISVKKIKGTNRPVQDQVTRSKILASMAFINYVTLFDEDTPYNLINIVQPDLLVKGGDYKPEDIAGFDIVTKKGGKIITIPLVKGHSTTGLIKKISK